MKALEFKQALIKLTQGNTLTELESELAMLALLEDEVQPEQVGAFLTFFHFRPPQAQELVGFIKALRTHSKVFHLKDSENLLDVCGTGGDGMGTFNVSTTVAFVAAASGQRVAKHGNRAVSSRCGSFDVLDALGVPYAHNFLEATQLLETFNLTFLYAPSFYPVLQKLGPVRRNLGFRTILNALGPLLNPINVGRQLMGVYSEALLLPIAETFRILGAREVLVVRAEDGTDELSLSSPTHVVHLKDQKLNSYQIYPNDFGLDAPVAAIAGGSSAENAQLLLSVLRGEKSAYRDITLFNTAAGLMVGGQACDIHEGILIASEAIDSGKAYALIESMQAMKMRMQA